MVFKINIGLKGKTWKLETEDTAIIGKSVGDKFLGGELGEDYNGYEFEITGGSDSSGFPLSKSVEGIGLKRVLLTYGWGMHKRPKGDKKKVSQPDGLRLKKTVRGKSISESTVQINLKVLKEGKKKFEEIFPEQNKPKEEEKKEENQAEEKVIIPPKAEGGEEIDGKNIEEVKKEDKEKEGKNEEAKPEEKKEEKPKEESPKEEAKAPEKEK